MGFRFLSLAGLLVLSGSVLAMKPISPYQSGQQVCEQYKSSEFGKRIQVPVSYDSSLGSTEIYAWTYVPFDPNKPSILYFNGGPGGTLHTKKEFINNLSAFNVIFMDQRGVACSRPETTSILEDYRYYKSEWIARDGAKVLKAYNLQKATIWGHSFGTVLATIFASQFPEMVQVVVLEGVVASSDQELWLPTGGIQRLENFYLQLPVDLKNKITEVSKSPKVDPAWFSVWSSYFVSASRWPLHLRNSFDSLLGGDLATQIDNVDYLTRDLDAYKSSDEDTPDGGIYSSVFIKCRELNGRQSYANRLFEITNSGFQRVSYSVMGQECDDHKIPSEPIKLEQYPFNTKAIYVHGEIDGTTSLEGALHHFKTLAKGPTQFIAVEQGGHRPLSSNDLQKKAEFNRLIVKILKGEFLVQKELDSFNATTDLKLKLITQ